RLSGLAHRPGFAYSARATPHSADLSPAIATRRTLDAAAFAAAAGVGGRNARRELVPAAIAALRRHVPGVAGKRICAAALGRTHPLLPAVGGPRRNPLRPLRRRRRRRAVRLARDHPSAPRWR